MNVILLFINKLNIFYMLSPYINSPQNPTEADFKFKNTKYYVYCC